MKYDSINIESLALTVLAMVGILSLVCGIMYSKHKTNECVAFAMTMEKSADDIKKICELR